MGCGPAMQQAVGIKVCASHMPEADDKPRFEQQADEDLMLLVDGGNPVPPQVLYMRHSPLSTERDIHSPWPHCSNQDPLQGP